MTLDLPSLLAPTYVPFCILAPIQRKTQLISSYSLQQTVLRHRHHQERLTPRETLNDPKPALLPRLNLCVSRMPPVAQTALVRTMSMIWSAWLAFTGWFFGPPLIERVVVASGGQCVLAVPGSGEVIDVPIEYCHTKSTQPSSPHSPPTSPR